MRKKNIVLIGFMGSGKSLVSSKLAEILKRKVVSTDELIEEREGRPITEIFKESGETHFREIEKKIVKQVSEAKNIVIDCGGGVVLNQDNIVNLKEKGVLVYLSASAKSIYENIKDKTHRPLLNVNDPEEKIGELLDQRKSLYEQADMVIETDGKSTEQICGEIVESMEGKW